MRSPLAAARGPRWRRPPQRDPWQRVRLGILLLLVVVAFGTVGYVLLGLSPFDALYQTVITVTTVGFNEIGVGGEASTGYRAFTLGLVVTGTGTVVYTLGLLVDTFIEGSLNDELRRRRMLREIEELEDHVIIAGWGRTGHAIAHSVRRAGQEIVVIDREPADDLSDHAVVIGEATDDVVLQQAGIKRARILVAALSNDADNLFVTLSARSLCPHLFIVARTSDQKNEPKFFQAGADRVVNPHEIGGSRMAAVALQPHVAEFLDEVLHDESHDVSVHEVQVAKGSPMVDRPLVELDSGAEGPPLIIAIRGHGGRYHSNPSPTTVLAEDEVIIALGSAAELSSLRDQLGAANH